MSVKNSAMTLVWGGGAIVEFEPSPSASGTDSGPQNLKVRGLVHMSAVFCESR